MSRDNNYGPINDLRRIQDEIMEAIAHINKILDQSLPVEELRLYVQAINDKQRTIRGRLHEHLRMVANCIALLDELEEREDLAQEEALFYLSKDQEEAENAKAFCLRANRAHGHWLARHLDELKGTFRHKEVYKA